MEKTDNSYNLPESPGQRTIRSLKRIFGMETKFVSGMPLNTSGIPWPQTLRANDFIQSEKLKEMYPGWTTTGFLPPVLCSPRI